MSAAPMVVQSPAVLGAAIERVLVDGDLSPLTPDQRVAYYKATCESVGLNPLTKPFDYLKLNGKLVLYANKNASDQLRKIHGISVVLCSKERIEDVYVVVARATDKTGRTDESTGAVPMPPKMGGEALANALMKCETKAKRRVTLSIVGLSMLDETEVDSIPGAQRVAPEAVEVIRPALTAVASEPKAPGIDVEKLTADFKAQIEKCGREGTLEELNAIVASITKVTVGRENRKLLVEAHREAQASIKAREAAKADAEQAFSGFEGRQPGDDSEEDRRQP